MWRCGATGVADVGDHIPFLDFLARANLKAGKMSMPGRDSISMINDEQVSIRCLPLRVDHHAIGRRQNLASVEPGNIQAKMHFTIPVKGIHPAAIMARNPALKRPDRWR